jgi:hypothetical protein
MTRSEIIRRAEDQATREWLHRASPQTVFGHALHRGLITREEYVAASRRYGNGWYYAGD